MTSHGSTVVDDKRYARLLAEALPKVVETEQENERLLTEIERLMRKGEKNLSPEGEALLNLLTQLVEAFEKRAYPLKGSTPAEVLSFLMEQNQMTSAALPLPPSRVSEILSGKREISKRQAKTLAEFFHVSPAVFI